MTKQGTYHGWPAGANNIAPDHALPKGKYGATVHARSIVNADVNDDGTLRRRKGFTGTILGAGISGATSYRGAIHYVQDGELKRRDGSVDAVLRTGLAPNKMAFLELNDSLYFSNGVDTGILNGDQASSWGVEYAEQPPVVAAVAGGMQQGTYSVLCTFVRASGEEGGCGPAATVTGTGFSVTAPASTDTPFVNVYATAPGDEIFRKVATVAQGATTTFLSPLLGGAELRTRYLRPMPPGVHLAEYRGRVYSGNGSVLWFSDPLRYGLCNISSNFLLFPDDISVVVPWEEGLFIGSDNLYKLTGKGPGEFEQVVEVAGKTAAHSAYMLPDGKGASVLTARGITFLGDDGNTEVFDETVSTGPANTGATLVREQDGLRQIVGVAYQPTHVSGMIASDFIEAEIIRKG